MPQFFHLLFFQQIFKVKSSSTATIILLYLSDSPYEEQVLEQVAKEQQELDNQLDQLEALMPVMKEMANVINENLDVTNQLAKDVTKKVQAADDKLSNVQGQIDEFQKEAKAANHLCYVIGFIILLFTCPCDSTGGIRMASPLGFRLVDCSGSILRD